MKNLSRKLLKLMALAIASSGLMFAAAPAVLAAGGNCLPSPSFIGFPPWWEYLNGQMIGGSCSPVVNWPGGVWKIGLAGIDILLHVAGLAAVISLLVAAVMYVTSAGSPDRAKSALDRIIGSLVGLAIALVATAAVKFIGSQIATTGGGGYNLPGEGVQAPPGQNASQIISQSTLTTGLEIFFGLLGVIAFLLMVIGGFNFVLSQGNPEKTSRARNTLIYAAVGLAVAASAAFIVSVVLGKSS